jgi:predicted permease
LVSAQTAVAFVLLAATVLLTVSVRAILSQPAGFNTTGVVTMRLAVPEARYPSREALRFYDELLEELRNLPSVNAAGMVSALPLTGGSSSSLTIQGREDVGEAMRPTVGWHWASPGYFDAMGMPLVHGRGFGDSDKQHAIHVTVINETLARLYFPGEDPIGKRVCFGPVPPQGITDWHEVVGVVGDVRHRSLESTPDPRAYDLFGQHWGRTVALAVESGESASQVAAAVRARIAARDPRRALFAVRDVSEIITQSISSRRLLLWLVATFAGVGVAVALVGLYGTVSYTVAGRTRELGVRIALGASAREIRRLVVFHGLRFTVAGIALGLAGTFAMRGLLETQLFAVQATSESILTLTALSLTLASAVACLAPANRAARVDPSSSLRAD